MIGSWYAIQCCNQLRRLRRLQNQFISARKEAANFIVSAGHLTFCLGGFSRHSIRLTGTKQMNFLVFFVRVCVAAVACANDPFGRTERHQSAS